MNLNNIKNLKEFKALIERYESITLEEIEKKIAKVEADPFWDHKFGTKTIIVARKLTGYGSIATCTLCIAVQADCYLCTWYKECGCNADEPEETYSNIGSADTSTELLAAFKARATFMREHLQKLGID